MAKLADALTEDVKSKMNDVKKNYVPKNNKGFNKEKTENGLPNWTKYYPMEVNKMVLLVKNNAEFRRLLSIAIKNTLIEDKHINADDKIYISYFPNKFSVKVNGLGVEYRYTEPVFVNNFAAAIVLFSTYAQYVLNNYAKFTNINVDVDYANNINNIIDIKELSKEKTTEE